MRKPFDLLREVARFGASQGVSLNDPAMPAAFGLHVDDSMKQAMSDPTFLQGLRAEAMFENLVTSLGEVMMIKSEDTGPLQSAVPMQAPDFRIVLKDGSNWLVEVKNVYVRNALRQRRKILKREYRRALNNYAHATGGTLKLAVFWARWSIWTLIDPEQLAPGDQDLTLDMMEAIKANEMAAIGDQTLGLRAPLTLRLTMDPDRTSDIGEDGRVLVTIGKAQLFSDGKELLHPHDQQIAWTVMNYSDWETPDARARVAGKRLLSIEFESKPRELSYQGFEMAGSLSRMFAHYYAQRTMSGGEVIDISAPVQAEWFTSLRSREGLSRMPLWRFVMQPNYEDFQPVDVAPHAIGSLPQPAALDGFKPFR